MKLRFRRRNVPVAAGVVLAAAALAACGNDQSAAEREPTADVPAGTPIIEHTVAGPSERFPLVLEREAEYRDPEGRLLFAERSTRLAAAPDGQLVVLSGEARRLAVFDDAGVLLREWGEPGTAARQLFGPVGVAVVGDEVVVADAAAMRLSRWKLDGTYVTEVSGESLQLIDGVIGSMDGGLLVKVLLRTEFDDLSSLTLFSLEGREERRFVQLLPDYSPLGQSIWPRPDAVVAPGGRLYATEAADYEVQAIEATGAHAWVLRVPWPRLPLDETAQRTIERTQRAGRALGANVGGTRNEPQALPSLHGIEVDGRGRLYVFPFAEPGTSDGQYPVDVYDAAAGRRLASGWLPFHGWDAQADDVIYRLEQTEGGAIVIARYRLIWE